MKLEKRLALCCPRRLPFAQIGKALVKHPSHHLGKMVAEGIFEHYKVDKNLIDGIIVGEGFPSSPNPARMICSLIGLADETPALTVNNNCVSGMESLVEAARRITLGEGELFLVLGQESLSSMPFTVKGARLDKKTATLDKLSKLLPDNLPEGVELTDTLEEGLGDGETSYGMQMTAEILAQNYEIPKETTDKFAYESFKRAYESFGEGKYERFMIGVDDGKGGELKADEAVLLRKGLVENPERMGKAMLLFENPYIKFDDFKNKYGKYLEKTHGPTITIFSASPRSDGAAGLLLTTEEKAKELGLKIEAFLSGWKMKGVDPNIMGIGQAKASLALVDEMEIDMEDVDYVEIHEAFAATAVASLEEIKRQKGWDWEKKFENKKINPNGGSISIGHPFGATGIRLAINGIMDLEQDQDAQNILLTACAHGGIAGALMLERAA